MSLGELWSLGNVIAQVSVVEEKLLVAPQTLSEVGLASDLTDLEEFVGVFGSWAGVLIEGEHVEQGGAGGDGVTVELFEVAAVTVGSWKVRSWSEEEEVWEIWLGNFSSVLGVLSKSKGSSLVDES